MKPRFDVLEKAASNEGTGGQMIGMGVGLGAGVGVGNLMGNIAGQAMNTNPATPPPLPGEKTYFIYLNGSQLGGQNMQSIANYIQQGAANADTLVWSVGMSNWARIADVPELSGLVPPVVPPPVM